MSSDDGGLESNWVGAVGAGQLRGSARAGGRRARALELALAGCDYDSIAAQVGYANRGTAWRAVGEALSTRVAANADKYRRLTLARLEALIAAHWDPATVQRNARSADLVLKVLTQQSRLLGLADRQPESVDQVRTVVVGGTSLRCRRSRAIRTPSPAEKASREPTASVRRPLAPALAPRPAEVAPTAVGGAPSPSLPVTGCARPSGSAASRVLGAPLGAERLRAAAPRAAANSTCRSG
jgi:hypothetical protein